MTKTIQIVALAAVTFLLPSANGATPSTAGPSAVPLTDLNTPMLEERYLILVNTAYSMRKIAKQSRQAVFDLVHWGANGHMYTGDTYGIWTFNSNPYPGRFPMQVYNRSDQVELATQASLFLKEQPNENNAETSKTLLPLLSIILTVKDVNVFVVTDADTPFMGLPIDEEINAACEERARERKKAKKPFVISLAARGGEIVDWKVTIAGEPIILPARRPAPPKAVETAKTTPKEDPKVSRKPKVLSVRVSNGPRSARIASPDAKPIIMKSTPPAAPTPAATPTKVPTPVLTKTGILPGAVRPSTKPVPTVTATSLPPAPAPTTIAGTPAPARPQPTALPNQSPPPSTEAAAIVPSNTPPPTDPPSPTDQVASLVPAASKAITVNAREPNRSRPAAAATPIVAVTIPPTEPAISATELFAAGGVLLLVAIGLVFVFIQRVHPATQTSFITQSMDNSPS